MRYKVTGTINLNWENTVDAESEAEAEATAKSYAEDGHGLNIPVEEPEVSEVTLLDG